MEIVSLDHFVIRDGMVVSNFVVFDQLQYARQIRMFPADGSAGRPRAQAGIQPADAAGGAAQAVGRGAARSCPHGRVPTR